MGNVSNKQSLDDWAAEFGLAPSKPATPKKPPGLRAGVETPAQAAARKKREQQKKKDSRSLREKMRDRRKQLDEI